MGTPAPPTTMAANQILVALCVVGYAVAAPQLSLGRSRSVVSSSGANVNENQVVSSVITSLTPSIAKAVEEALAQAAAAEQAAAEAAAAAAAEAEAARLAQIEAERRAAAEAEALAAAAEAERQQRIAAANAAAAAAAAEKNSFDSQVSADLGPYVDPVYNFEYKVADDEEKTYISRNENRDGNELSGSYSFIDATGAVAVAKTSTSSSSRFGSSSGSRTSSAITSTSSSGSQSDLIAQILAALTPQINSAVAAALA